MKFFHHIHKKNHKLTAYVLAIFILLLSNSGATTYAITAAPDYINANQYKQQNDIFFYEKSTDCIPGTQPAGEISSATANATPAAGESTGATVYNYLIGNGLSPIQALGIIGNLMQESGGGTLNLKTTAVSSDGHNSLGIAQWTGARRTALEKAATQAGVPVSDIGLQSGFLWNELNGAYKKNTLDPLMQTDDLRTAVTIVLKNFERPKDQSINEINRRLGFAEKAAKELGIDLNSASSTQGSDIPTVSPLSVSSSTNVDCTPKNDDGNTPGGAGGGTSGGLKPTGENGKLDLSQLAKVTIACEGSWSEPYLTVDASAALTQLNSAFKQRFGRDMHGISCYRSYEKQQEAKNYWTARGKPQNAATPGTSNHGWGLAIDLQASKGVSMTYSSAEYKWLMQNAGTYGYCNPANMQQGGSGPHEPWHWQYKQGC